MQWLLSISHKPRKVNLMEVKMVTKVSRTTSAYTFVESIKYVNVWLLTGIKVSAHV